MIWALLVCAYLPQDAEPATRDLDREIGRYSESWWDGENREFKRVELPKEKKRKPLRSRGRSVSVLGPVAYWLAKLVAVLVIAALVAVIVITIIRARRNIEFEIDSPVDLKALKLRRHLLPDELQNADGDLLQLARQARRQSRFREAFAYLYGYVLLTFDARHYLVLQRGKTNYAYIREVSQQSVGDFFTRLVRAFEEHFFGPNPQDGDGWDRLHQEFKHIEGSPAHES